MTDYRLYRSIMIVCAVISLVIVCGGVLITSGGGKLSIMSLSIEIPNMDELNVGDFTIPVYIIVGMLVIVCAIPIGKMCKCDLAIN